MNNKIFVILIILSLGVGIYLSIKLNQDAPKEEVETIRNIPKIH